MLACFFFHSFYMFREREKRKIIEIKRKIVVNSATATVAAKQMHMVRSKDLQPLLQL